MSARREKGAALVLGLLLAGWGLRWGLPSEYGWAPDELLPQDVAAAAAQGFAHGWHSKYPPLHYVLLFLLGAPVRAFAAAVGAGPAAVHDLLMSAGRLLSLAMAAGTLLAVQRCGSELGAPRAGVLGSALLATFVPFVYYAKTANLDVPYLFWFALSLLFYLRALGRGATRDFVLFACAAAAAVATKDQAYALYVLTVPFLAARARDRRALAMLAAGAGAYVVLSGVLVNPAGALAHVRLITGTASTEFRMFERGVVGRLLLLWETARHLVFAMGWPALLAALAGVLLGLRDRARDRRLLLLLVPALSYVLFFLLVVLYVYDRFLLPVATVLALPAGAALARALAAPGWTWRAAAWAVLAFGVVRAATVDLLLAHDSRYTVEQWLRREVGAHERVAAVGPLEYLPRPGGGQWRRMGPAASRLAQLRPDVVVVNADYAARADEGSAERDFYAGLDDGRLGYAAVLRHRGAPDLPLLDVAAFRREGPGRIWSNLDKVDPEIVVYRRRDGAGLTR